MLFVLIIRRLAKWHCLKDGRKLEYGSESVSVLMFAVCWPTFLQFHISNQIAAAHWDDQLDYRSVSWIDRSIAIVDVYITRAIYIYIYISI